MLSPDAGGSGNKRSSIRLTLKTSTLVSQHPPQLPSPELTSPTGSRSRHHHNTRRSTTCSVSEDDFKFNMPPLPERLGRWEDILLQRFAKLRKLKGNDSAVEESNVESSPVQVASAAVSATDVGDTITSPTTGGESAREHAIKLVLSGHLRFESQSDASRKCVSRKRSSVISRSNQAPDSLMSPSGIDDPETFLKPAEPEPFSPTVPVKIKLPRPPPVAPSPPFPATEVVSPKAELRKQVFIRARHLTNEFVEKSFKDFAGYSSHVFNAERSSAVVDFDAHQNALAAVKITRSQGLEGVADLFVCLTRYSAGDSTPFEASQYEASLAEQTITSPVATNSDSNVEEMEVQQQWNVAQRRVAASVSSTTLAPSATTVTPAAVIKSPQTESAPTMAPRELQTYEDVF